MTIEQTGNLLFECDDIRTVDENDLPISPNAGSRFTYQRDGIQNYQCIEHCCEALHKFCDEYYGEAKMGISVYPDLLDVPKGEPSFYIDVKTHGEYDDETSMQLKCCPWCYKEPQLIINKKKRIHKCIEIEKTVKEQSCQESIVDDE